MSDIPQRLRQLFDSIAPTIDVEHLDASRLPFTRRWTGWQIGLVSGLAVALFVGGGLVFLSDGASDLASGESTTTVSETTPPPAGSQSRWDWIIAHSTPTNDENLRVADSSATPLPTFDYAALGTEQLLVIGDPAIPSFDRGGGAQSVAPWVYVGTVANTAAGGYLFESDGSARAPVRTELEDGTVLPVVCLTVSVSPDVTCFLDGEPAYADGLIAGVSGVSSSGLQGEVTVSMWVPRTTAIAVLNLDDGRSLVQRPVGGVALFVITDLGGAAVESAEALGPSGQVVGHEDFLTQWQAMTLYELPYLGLDLPGWEFWRAAESMSFCSDQVEPMEGSTRGVTYTFGAVAPEDDPLFTEVPSISINILPASTRCFFQDVPTGASDLGPPADPPFVIDHGMTAVMGHEARVIEEQGVFSVMWLLDDEGSTAKISVFPRDTAFTLDQVIAIAAGIVELTPSEWEALLAATPETPPVTVP